MTKRHGSTCDLSATKHNAASQRATFGVEWRKQEEVAGGGGRWEGVKRHRSDEDILLVGPVAVRLLQVDVGRRCRLVVGGRLQWHRM